MKKKYIILITIAIVLLISVFIIIYLLVKNKQISNNDQTDFNSQTTVSYPSNENSGLSFREIDNKDIEFTLNQTTVASPLKGETEDFTFQSELNQNPIELAQIGNQGVVISSENINIIIYLKAESFGGIYNAMISEQSIPNHLNISELSRVENKSVDFAKEEFSIYGLSGKKYYFYTDTKTGDAQCAQVTKDQFCGEAHITIKGTNGQGIDATTIIYCSVNNEQDVKYCDEFVSNLKVKSENLKIYPVSYFR